MLKITKMQFVRKKGMQLFSDPDPHYIRLRDSESN